MQCFLYASNTISVDKEYKKIVVNISDSDGFRDPKILLIFFFRIRHSRVTREEFGQIFNPTNTEVAKNHF